MISECTYDRDTLDDLLKDQFMFGITVKKIQDSLSSIIVSDHSIGKCILETRKI